MTLTRPVRQKIVVALLICVSVTVELLSAALVISDPESGSALAYGVVEAGISIGTLVVTVVLAMRPSRVLVRCLRTLLVVGGLLAVPLVLLVLMMYRPLLFLPTLVVVGGAFVFSVDWVSKFLVPNSPAEA